MLVMLRVAELQFCAVYSSPCMSPSKTLLTALSDATVLQASLRTAKASRRDRKPLRVFAAAPVMACVKPRMPTRACCAAAPLMKPAGFSGARSIRASAAAHRPAAVMFA